MSSITAKGNSFLTGMFLHSSVDDADLTVYEFRVYGRLCRRANDEKRVWEGQKKIADGCGMSRSQAQKALYGLRDKGWIELLPSFREDGGQGTNDIVVLGPPGASREGTPLPRKKAPPARSEGTPPPVMEAPPAREEGTLSTSLEVDPLEGNPYKDKNTHIPHLTADAAVSVPSPTPVLPDPVPQKSETQTSAPLPVQAPTPPPAKADLSTPEALDKVPGGAARPSALLARIFDAYNAHRGHLPAVEVANAGREKHAKALLRQFGSADLTVAAVTDAARHAACDPFWAGKPWGIDNLLPKVASKAEAWRSRPAAPPPQDPSAAAGPRELSYEERYPDLG